MNINSSNPPDCGVVHLASQWSPQTIDVEELSLFDMEKLLCSGKLTSELLVSRYLDRILKIDQEGPRLNSIIEINPDARSIAKALDKERVELGRRGPLHGVPVLIKDNIDTADQMQTTAGSLALLGNCAVTDAFLVQRLRTAGAVILGKTNLSEWSNGRGLNSVSGWSSRGGLTRNPYSLDRSASGSSSGSAAATAASLCAAAVGTETDGSLLSPASVCGVVALKPTVGLISRHGVIPISMTMDTPGPIARSVRDCAILLNALVGKDATDPATQESPYAFATDFATGLNADALRGARLGVARDYFGFHQKAEEVYSEVLEALRMAGAILVDPVKIPTSERLKDAKRVVLLYEMKAGLNAYFEMQGLQCPVKTVQDVIEFNKVNSSALMQWFGQELLQMASAKGDLNEDHYLSAVEVCNREGLTEGIEETLHAKQLDAFIAPTEGPAWKTDMVLGDHFLGGSTSPAAIAGTPSITVPAGMVNGLPLGFSFFSAKWSEIKLLNLAFSFESCLKARRRPDYLPRIE